MVLILTVRGWCDIHWSDAEKYCNEIREQIMGELQEQTENKGE